MLQLRVIASGFLLALLLPVSGLANESGACSYEGEIFPEGTEVCREGSRQRCRAGSWGDIGFCGGGELPSSPGAEEEGPVEEDEREGL